MEYSSLTAQGTPSGAFDGSPGAKLKPNYKTVKQLSLYSGSLVSIWYASDTDLSAIEFTIKGRPIRKKAVYRPFNGIGFDDWLKQHADNDYDMLIVEQGHLISDIDKALIIWNAKWHTQCIVIYDAVGLVSLTALADRCYEVSANSEVREFHPDF